MLLVVTRSKCAPGRLGDKYFTDLANNDQFYDDETTKTTTDSSDETENCTSDYDESYYDSHPIEVPLEQLQNYIQQLAEQDGTTKGRYVYTDKTGRNITVVYVAGPSALMSDDDSTHPQSTRG